MPTWGTPMPAWVGPICAGGAYAALWLATAHGFAALLRWLSRRPERLARALGAWRLGGLMSGVGAAAALDVLLIYGALTAFDVGLCSPDWAATWQWLPSVACVLALWLALLWGAAWWGRAGTTSIPVSLGWESPWDLPAYLAFHEASLAILRGALTPAIGTYWGAWLAVPLKMGIATLSPGGLTALREANRRPWTLLGASLDWASTAAIIVSGSLWPGLIVRSLGLLGTVIAYRWARRIGPKKTTGCPSRLEGQPQDGNTA